MSIGLSIFIREILTKDIVIYLMRIFYNLPRGQGEGG